MKKLKIFLITVLSSCLVVWLSVEGWAFKQFISQPIPSLNEDRIIAVEKGASSRTVAKVLFEQKIIHHPDWFVWYLRYQGKSQKIQAGEKRLPAGATVDQVIEILVNGQTVTYPVTFIEGHTLAQAIMDLKQAPKIKQQLPLKWKAFLKAELDIPWPLEGQFLPETYFYTAGESDLSILKRAHLALQQTLQQAWQNRQPNLPFKTPYEALVLASIVEKETGHAPERPMIAGVFVNRLRKGMRLQSDPTVIYGMGDKYDGNIRKKDLLTKTAYNTYRINGLPPTPIALPSADAIQAVMQPAKTKALYFVANGNGHHRFSETLAEHNQAVQDYLRKLKQQK